MFPIRGLSTHFCFESSSYRGGLLCRGGGVYELRQIAKGFSATGGSSAAVAAHSVTMIVVGSCGRAVRRV